MSVRLGMVVRFGSRAARQDAARKKKAAELARKLWPERVLAKTLAGIFERQASGSKVADV
ncbi:MAG: hypothetical protein AB7F96_10425 [Beijerinckiaceae bacterium]